VLDKNYTAGGNFHLLENMNRCVVFQEEHSPKIKTRITNVLIKKTTETYVCYNVIDDF
jgi:hypothetical protein